jgi:hypothetical protein
VDGEGQQLRLAFDFQDIEEEMRDTWVEKVVEIPLRIGDGLDCF